MKRRFIGVALIGLSLFAMMLTFAFRKGAKDSEEAELATTLRVAVAADAAAEDGARNTIYRQRPTTAGKRKSFRRQPRNLCPQFRHRSHQQLL